jgi:hypothetical protein
MTSVWRTSLLALAACAFTHGAASSTQDGSGDAPPPPPQDAALPDASYPACMAMPMGMPMPAGVLGGTGGGTPNTPTACGPGEVAVGMGFDYSPDQDGGNETTIIDVIVRCGTLARDTTGRITTTFMETHMTPTGGICFGITDDSIPEQDCASGSVVVGMTANEAGTSLYNTVTVQCAAVTADFTISAATTTFTYATGSFDDKPQTAMCPPNTAFSSFALRTGCANDLLGPRCVALGCMP